jgi:uncharacterized membrane protein YfcA
MKIQITTIIAGLLIGSIAYHLNVENTIIMGLPSYQVSWISMSLGALIGAFLISIFSKEKTSEVASLVFAGIILSIIIQIVYDLFFTSKTHNLLGLEIILYSILCLPTAFIGAYLGKFITRWKKN